MNWIDMKISLDVILGVIAIFFAIYWNSKQYKQMNMQLKAQNEQLRQQNEQIRHSYFSEYTKRYQEIILHFPENINDDNFSYDDLDPSERDKTLRYMRIYFDLCSEEFFLYKHKYIMPDVWKEWEKGMKFAFQKPAFKIAWDKISNDTGYYTNFANFVEETDLSSAIQHLSAPEEITV